MKRAPELECLRPQAKLPPPEWNIEPRTTEYRHLSPATSLAEMIRQKPRALTVHDLAGVLNVSERQIYKLAAEKCIPSFRICGSVRFDPIATANWLNDLVAGNELYLGIRARNRIGKRTSAFHRLENHATNAIEAVLLS